MPATRGRGGTIGWLALLLLPLTVPIWGAVTLGRMVLFPRKPNERVQALVIGVGAVAWLALLWSLPDAVTPILFVAAIAFLAAVSFAARRSVK